MRARIALALTCTLVTLATLVGCDRSPPLAPPLEATKGRTGPTPSAPSNTSAGPWSMSRVAVSWQDNSANETAFELWRSPNGPLGTFAKIAAIGANGTGFSDEGLNPRTPYCYRVRAVRTFDGKTAFSAFGSILGRHRRSHLAVALVTRQRLVHLLAPTQDPASQIGHKRESCVGEM